MCIGDHEKLVAHEGADGSGGFVQDGVDQPRTKSLTKPIKRSFTTMGIPRADLPPCDCGWFEQAARDPDCSVEFDPMLNEYNLKTANGGSMRMYHCPFCAGRAPESLRCQMFAEIPLSETHRLRALTREIKTEEDALRVLGQPKHRYDPGAFSLAPEREGQAPEMKCYLTLIYDQHSATADIHVTIDHSGRTSVSFQGRYIGLPTDRS